MNLLFTAPHCGRGFPPRRVVRDAALGDAWFWFGSQGYEYVDLGRCWQIVLFVGLVFWLGLMVRALRPALARQAENQSLLILFLVASIAIPLFYAAGLMYGQQSHLVTAEYWRWWWCTSGSRAFSRYSPPS